MRRLLGLAAVATLLLVPAMLATGGFVGGQSASCGTDRPDVGTLTDPNVGDIDTSGVIGVHVSTLAAFPIPDQLPADARFNPYETTVYIAEGELVRAQLEPNQDIDVVLQDPDTNDLITVVFPDAARCAQGADPELLQLMEQARQTFLQAFGTPASTSSPLNGMAVVAGVGFIPAASELAQGGSGTGIELHPVLNFALAPGTSLPEPSATSQPAPGASSQPTPPAASPAAPAATSQPAPLATGQPALPQTNEALAGISATATVAHVFYVDVAPNAGEIYRLNGPCQSPV